MAAYYSLASKGTFADRLTDLVNAVAEQPKGNEDAERILGHLEGWADGLYQGEKELLLAAVEKRSFMTLDLIAWIVHVTKTLTAAANAPAASDHIKEHLQRHAVWLISVLDWLPDDKDAVTYLETFRVTEQLFEASMDARARDAQEVAEAARDTLLHWAFKAGQHQTGWASLERAMTALALLAAWQEDSPWPKWLLAEVKERLGKNTITNEQRQRAAKELRRETRNRGRSRFAFSATDRARAQVDRERFEGLINALADLLAQAEAAA
jgi:hypothetical protein